MAQGNGHDQEAAASSQPNRVPAKHTVFMIGDKEVIVPPLTFWCLETLDPELEAIGRAMMVREHSDHVLRIIATSIEAAKAGEDEDPTQEAIDKTFARFKRKIIWGEMKMLGDKVNELLANSGYDMTPAGEAQAASPGTETSTDSSPNLQSEGSATPTQSESSVN